MMTTRTTKLVFLHCLSATLLLLSACDNATSQKNSTAGNITFQPYFNDTAISCSSAISHSNKHWSYTQLQFFISNIELKNGAGQWQQALLEHSPYQTKQAALLGEQCYADQKSNNKANWVLQLDSNSKLNEATDIRFTLGLPFAINHLNPLTQESPLNIPSMFWSWQIGHKFLRLEMVTKDDTWLYHLGSIGCSASSPMRSPEQECRYPNRYEFELPLNKQHKLLKFELASLLNNVTLSAHTSCQSSPDSFSCQTLMSNLNLRDENSVFHSQITENTHE